MKIKSISLVASSFVLATNVNAAIVTQGFLTYNDDGSSNVISDSLNNVEYLSFDLLADLNYAETLAVLNTVERGGWSIATVSDTLNFTQALLGSVVSNCGHNGADVAPFNCGSLTGWADGKLGDNSDTSADILWFLDSNSQADSVQIFSSGFVALFDGTLASSDTFSVTGGGSTTITWLVTRETVVPVPATVWLFGSGLLGLIAVTRRKA